MSSALVNGYVLVGAPGDQTRLYMGPDRDAWGAVNEHYYTGILPNALRMTYESLRADASRGLWWVTSKDAGEVTRFIEFERANGRSVELLGVHSPYLTVVQERQPWREPRGILLGIDVISVGEWSLLRAIQESSHPKCDGVKVMLNDAGLLTASSDVSAIERKYRQLADMNAVEPIAEPDSGIVVEAVEVFALGT